MEVKDLEKGAQLARTFSVLIIPTLSPGDDCKGCSAWAGLQEGQVAGEELRTPLDHGSPQSPLVCVPFKPRWSQVSSPFLRPLTLPLHPPSLHPMLIYNLQPPGQSPFFLTLHCAIATSYPVQDRSLREGLHKCRHYPLGAIIATIYHTNQLNSLRWHD